RSDEQGCLANDPIEQQQIKQGDKTEDADRLIRIGKRSVERKQPTGLIATAYNHDHRYDPRQEIERNSSPCRLIVWQWLRRLVHGSTLSPIRLNKRVSYFL